MRTLRVFVSILAVISVVATVFLWARSIEMNEKPVITCSVDGDLQVKCSVTDKELLKYVTATDGRDGDITSKVVIERKKFFVSKGITTINYAVCDSDNNVTKLSKNLHFTDYHAPRFTLKNDLISYINNPIDFANSIGAYDAYDGDISDRVKIISSTYSSTVSGKYDIDCKVTNSFGDTSEIVFKAIVLDGNPDASRIRLKDYIIYTTVGEQPDFAANISDFNGNAEKQLEINTDDYNPDKAGVYSVYYEVSGRIETRVLVVVEEL